MARRPETRAVADMASMSLGMAPSGAPFSRVRFILGVDGDPRGIHRVRVDEMEGNDGDRKEAKASVGYKMMCRESSVAIGDKLCKDAGASRTSAVSYEAEKNRGGKRNEVEVLKMMTTRHWVYQNKFFGYSTGGVAI